MEISFAFYWQILRDIRLGLIQQGRSGQFGNELKLNHLTYNFKHHPGLYKESAYLDA